MDNCETQQYIIIYPTVVVIIIIVGGVCVQEEEEAEEEEIKFLYKSLYQSIFKSPKICQCKQKVRKVKESERNSSQIKSIGIPANPSKCSAF